MKVLETVEYLVTAFGGSKNDQVWDVLYNNHVTDVGVGIREYDETDTTYVTANWNHIDREIGDFLESEGVECLWSDEWATCDECLMVVRVTADSYIWQPRYIWYQGGILCVTCAADLSPEEILYNNFEDEGYINNPFNALTKSFLDAMNWSLESEKFTLVSDRNESGLHPGMDADPVKVFESLRDRWDEIVFVLSDVSQFYVTFDVYGRMKQEDDE